MSSFSPMVRRGPWRTLSDADLLHSLCVALLACLLTGGLLCVGYFARVWWIAARAPVTPARSRNLMLFGKRLVNGGADADFLARIARAHSVALSGRCTRIVLLGGSVRGEPGEAVVALAELRRLGVPQDIDIAVEARSTDTLENLRNARGLLGACAQAPVALLSSRYHLARIGFLAGHLGFDTEFCAAEARFAPTPTHLRRIALEAAYIFWADMTVRWGRLIRNRHLGELLT